VAYSLIDVKSKFNLVVMYTGKVSEEALKTLDQLPNCILKRIDLVEPPSQITYANPIFAEVWTKLKIFSLIEYKRIVWIDADMLVLKNMDDLFTLEIPADTIAACPDCLCNPFESPNFPSYQSPMNCYHNNNDTKVSYFNAGLLVVTPSQELFDKLINAMNTWELTNFMFAEQDLLNKYFEFRWVKLSPLHNFFQAFMKSHPEFYKRLNEIKNIHYTGPKPWMNDIESEKMKKNIFYPLQKIWWEKYYAAIKYFDLNQPNVKALTLT